MYADITKIDISALYIGFYAAYNNIRVIMSMTGSTTVDSDNVYLWDSSPLNMMDDCLNYGLFQSSSILIAGFPVRALL